MVTPIWGWGWCDGEATIEPPPPFTVEADRIGTGIASGVIAEAGHLLDAASVSLSLRHLGDDGYVNISIGRAAERQDLTGYAKVLPGVLRLAHSEPAS